jgi:hypothetical protein
MAEVQVQEASGRLAGVVVEPSLPVANTLLEMLRRVVGDVAARGQKVCWCPPQNLVAPLCEIRDPRDHIVEIASDCMRGVLRGVEEAGVQAAWPTVEALPGEGERYAIVSVVSSPTADVAALAQTIARGLCDLGIEGEAPASIRIPCGGFTGAAAAETIREVLAAGPETPVASWLLAGVCLAAGPVDEKTGLWLSSRIRAYPLKRLGGRRDNS